MCATCECTCPRCMSAVKYQNAITYYAEAFQRACADGNATDAAEWKGEGEYQHFNEKLPRHDTLAEIAEGYVNAQEFHSMFQLVLDAARGCLNAACMKDRAGTLLKAIALAYGERMADEEA